MAVSNPNLAWYVMRVSYQRELAVKSVLDRLEVENFLPMRTVRRRNAQGRFARFREVAMHNYIFVRSVRSVLDDLKTFRLPMLRYMMHVENGERRIMVVPDEQMNSFMAVARCQDEPVLYLSAEEVDLDKGDRVRIVGGVFEGVEGTFLRLKNARDRRVVVKIEGLVAVATATLPASLVEKI